jgi:hypothetical protein
MKKLLFLFFIYFSNSVYSNEIKLNCSSTLKNYIDGKIYKDQQGMLIVEIQEFNKNIFILTGGIYQLSVSTILDKSYTVTNLSNPNAWNITNSFINPTPDIKSSRTHLRIDRDTGTIYSSFDTLFKTNQTSLVVIQGNCSRVDTIKKKF